LPLTLSWIVKDRAEVEHILVEKRGEKVAAEYYLKKAGNVTLKNTSGHIYSLKSDQLPAS
jgi:hypothetical protein